MSQYETKDNSGAMFVNDRKETDRHPDRTGKALIDGVEYWVSGWIKQGRDGKPSWLSLAFKRKDDAQGGQRQQSHQSHDLPPQYGNHEPVEESDIPF